MAAREQHPFQHPQFHYPGPDILVFRAPPLPNSKAHAMNAVVMSNGELDWHQPVMVHQKTSTLCSRASVVHAYFALLPTDSFQVTFCLTECPAFRLIFFPVRVVNVDGDARPQPVWHGDLRSDGHAVGKGSISTRRRLCACRLTGNDVYGLS